jgi:hypothetical protein
MTMPIYGKAIEPGLNGHCGRGGAVPELASSVGATPIGPHLRLKYRAVMLANAA